MVESIESRDHTANMPGSHGSPGRKGNKEITGPFCHLLDLVLEMEVK